MNFKLTMTLVAVFLALAIGLMLIRRNTPATNSTTGATPLLATKPESIKSISYLRDNRVQVKFEKDGDNWRMVEPMKGAADSFTLNPLASTLQNMNYLRKFEPEATGNRSPESTGTAKPRNVVKFTDDKGKEYVLSLGYRSNDGTFATLDGGKTIYVLAADPISSLNKDPQEFRDKDIKRIDTTRVVKLEVKTSQTVDGKVSHETVTLNKTDGKWLVTAPVSARVNTLVVEDILRALGEIKAVTFTTLDKKLAGVDPGLVTVTAWEQAAPASAPATGTSPATATAASQSQPALTPAVTLQLGYFADALNRDSSSVYASVAGSDDVFTFARGGFNTMNKQLKDLRDPAVMASSVRQATEFALTKDGAVTVAVAKKGDEWSLSTPLALPADGFSVSDYLNLIGDLRAIKFVDGAGDLKSLALEPPHMKLDLTVPGQTQHEVLLIGKPEEGLEGGKVTPVMRQGEPTVYLLQSGDADRLNTTAVALRKKDIERLDAGTIQKIEIAGPLATVGVDPLPPATAPATGTAPATAAATAPAPLTPGVILERDGTRWVVRKGADSRLADDSKLTALLSDFTPLAAARYVDDKVSFPGTPDVTVTITMVETAKPAPATLPATAPATMPASAPATGPSSAPATASASAPAVPDLVVSLPTVGPDPGKVVTRTLKLYRQEAPATASAPASASAPATAPATQPGATWKAVWDNQSPAWTFEPSSFLVDHLTKATYTVSPASTNPAPMEVP